MKYRPRTRSHIPDPGAGSGFLESRRARAAHPHLQLATDGVVAGYIHDISIRHRGRQTDPYLPRRRGAQE